MTTRDRAGATRYRYLGDECDAAVTRLRRGPPRRPPLHTAVTAASPRHGSLHTLVPTQDDSVTRGRVIRQWSGVTLQSWVPPRLPALAVVCRPHARGCNGDLGTGVIRLEWAALR